MRIAYLLNSLGIGGAEKQVVGLAERMRARGHIVIILVLTPPAGEQWATSVNVVHLNLRKSLWSLIANWIRAVGELREFKADLLHCHNFHGNIFGRMLKLALPDVCVVSTIHNVYEGGRLRMVAYRLSDPLCRRTVAVCEAAARKMVEAGAVPRRKCGAIANGIDANEFTPVAIHRNQKRSQLNTDDRFLWIAASRIVPAKDIENLLRAFSVVRDEEPRAHLWVAGEGKSKYAEQMRALVCQLGLARSVRWLGMRRDLVQLFNAGDAFVLSSAWEGIPLALGEAMAMEKPVVATDVGGVRELIGDCGTIVSPGNSAALANGMLQLMREASAARGQMGRAARRRIVEQFSMDRNADAWERLYGSELNLE